MRVLGVDPGLTRCGVGVVDGAPGRPLTLVEAGVIRTPADADLPLWDHLDPPSFGAGAAPGYWALFPERLRAALAELDGTR